MATIGKKPERKTTMKSSVTEKKTKKIKKTKK